MRNLVSFFVKYPFWSNVFILVTVIAGTFAFISTRKSYFPEKNVKDIYVDVIYPGASPEEVEESVTNQVEDNLRGIVGIDEITSTSNENSAKIRVIIENRADIDEVLADVKNAVDQINAFPTGAEKPKVYKQKPLDFCMRLSLTGDKDLLKTKEVSELIYDDLLETGFISQVNVNGVGEPELSIEFKEETLERFNLSLSQVQTQLTAFNRDLTVGSIKSEQQEYFLRYRNKTNKPEEIRRIPIITENGNEVLLGDLATVTYQLPPNQSRAVLNGEPSVNITIFKLPEEDILEINDYVNSYIEEFNKQNKTYKIYVIFDASESVRGRINLLKNNGIIGLALVLVVLGIFLNFRLSFWVAVGIPISFLGMFIFAVFAGITVNQISLFGMILVTGILVDDGIVIAENIYSKMEQGFSAKKAAIEGTLEVLPAVFTSVITTMLVFSTFFFIDGSIGDIIPEMGIVVIGCLGYSLIEAALLLPAHLNNKKIKQEPGKIRKTINKGIDTLRYKWYQNYLKFAIEWKWVSLSVGIALVAVSIAVFKSDKVGKAFFPALDSNQINVEVAFYPGQSTDETEKFLKEITAEIYQVSDSLDKVGKTPIRAVRYTIGQSELAAGNHAGTIEIRLEKPENRTKNNSQISAILRQKLNLVNRAPQSTVGGRVRFGKPVSYKLISKNQEQLTKAKTFFVAALNKMSQVADITDNDDSGAKELQFALTDKAINLGFTPADVVTELRRRFFGTEIQKLQKRSKELKVWLRLDEEKRNRISSLTEVKIKKGDYLIPLSELANWSFTSSNTSIKHFNGAKEISIEALNANPDLPIAPVIDKIEGEVLPALLKNYPEVRYELGGQAKSQKKFGSSAILLAVFILIVIYFVIGLTFRSWLQPLLVILMIVPAAMGAVIGHLIEDTFLVIMSYLGSIALIGIIVNDAVVFVDKFNRNLSSGMKFNDAVIDAGTSRFRAIILTSITTMAGLYPLIFEDSTQAKFLIPMAITITYGVFFGTIMILFFFPIVLSCVNEARRLIRWIWTGEWVEAHLVEPAVKEKLRLKNEGYQDEE